VKGSATVGGPNGHRSNGSEIEGRPDPRLKTGVPDEVPDGVPNRGRTGCLTGWPDGMSRRGGQTGCPTGPDGVPDGWPNGVASWGARQVARRGQTGATSSATSFFEYHVIGHVIFECHVTRLGWQGVILLPTLVSQR
jgi:hypothetical protein